MRLDDLGARDVSLLSRTPQHYQHGSETINGNGWAYPLTTNAKKQYLRRYRSFSLNCTSQALAIEA